MNAAEATLTRQSVRHWIAALALLLAPFLVYLPAWHGQFIWDDPVSLSENPLIPRRDGLYCFWFTSVPQDYFPLTFTSFWLEYRLWGLNPMGYHLTNILLHALGAVLLWRVLLRLKVPGAWLAALVFALHPVCVASVAWISERKNTLSLPLCLLSMLFYLRYDELASPQSTAHGPVSAAGPRAIFHSPWMLYLMSLAAFALSLLAKSSVVVLPGVLLLCAWWQHWQERRSTLVPGPSLLTPRFFLRLAPFFALAVASSLLTIWFQHHRAMTAGSAVQTENLWQRLAAAGCALWFYLYKALLPVRLSAVYPLWDFTHASLLAFLPFVAFTALLGLGWWYRAGWGRHLCFALGCFALALLPVLGFVDMFYLTYSRVADHWAYLCLPSVIALLVGAATSLWGSQCGWSCGWQGRWPLLLCLCVLGWLASATWQRAHVYASEVALWRDTAQKDPFCAQAHNNLGFALYNAGRSGEAKPEIERALQLNPVMPEAHNNMGMLLDNLDQHERATPYYQEAIRLCPSYSDALNNLGANLFEQGKTNEALAAFEAALGANPKTHLNLATYFLKIGSVEQALAHARLALRDDPRNSLAFYIAGNCFLSQGQAQEAADHYRIACRLKPEWAEAHENLALALEKLGRATEAQAEFDRAAALRPAAVALRVEQGRVLAENGQWAQATEKFQESIRLNPRNSEVHNRLGFVLAVQGKLAQAIPEFREALRLDPRSADAHKNLANALFKTGQPEPALAEYQEVLRLQSGNSVIHARVGTLLVGFGRSDEALAHFKEAVRLEPSNAAAHYGLANCLLKQGQPAAATDQYLNALKTNPGFAEAHYQLSLALQAQQDFRGSRDHLREAVRLRPDWPEALNNLAWLLATHKDPGLRDGPEAVRLAERVVSLSHSNDAGHLDTLAAAYAEAGQFSNAVVTARTALALARQTGLTNDVREISTRLALYKAGRPCREP
jgi:tetratricopeptide (TPR) repeat protein